jgi:hypothetical protein
MKTVVWRSIFASKISMFSLAVVFLFDQSEVSWRELNGVRGQFQGGGGIALCQDFFISEENDKVCMSPFPDVDDSCLGQGCVVAGDACSFENRHWKNEPIPFYWVLNGSNEDWSLKLDPKLCYIETECYTRPTNWERSCNNPGPTWDELWDILDVGGIPPQGSPCVNPFPNLPTGCRNCEPRAIIYVTDIQHLENFASKIPCDPF